MEGSESVSITLSSGPIRISGPSDRPVSVLLEVPGVIRRNYFGVWDILNDAGVVIPVVSMNCEIAAGSIVAAEFPVYGAPFDALMTQAVVSRSLLCAAMTPRHPFADFCDTTHCQFLREPQLSGSNVANAIRATAGVVLFEHGRMLPCRYSAACGGTTESGVDGDYHYVSVNCEICRRSGTVRRGHGWGLCQEGAMGLARLGVSWRAILAKYYPNATVGLMT